MAGASPLPSEERTSQDPTTLEAALAVIAQHEAAIAEHEAVIALLRSLNASLQHQLAVLARKMFQRKTDELDPRQLKLAMEQLQNEKGSPDEPVEMDSGETTIREHRRKKTGRRQIPAHLPRRVVTIEPNEAARTCACGTAKTRILEEQSEKIDYIPATFEVVRTVRGVWACQRCHDGVTVAPLPPQAVEKGLAAEGLLGQVVGFSDTNAGQQHAFLWEKGTMTDLGTLGAETCPRNRCSQASFINDLGEVVGWSITATGEEHAFLWKEETMTDLGTLGGSFSGALSINDRGQVVGFSTTASSEERAVLWTKDRDDQ